MSWVAKIWKENKFNMQKLCQDLWKTVYIYINGGSRVNEVTEYCAMVWVCDFFKNNFSVHVWSNEWVPSQWIMRAEKSQVWFF